MPDDWRIEASTFGCVMMLGALGYAMNIYGAAAVGFWYFGPLLITNAYLILYTWLQHTHPDVPHYGSDAYSRLKGALSTIDRPYNWIVDHCHHRASGSASSGGPDLHAHSNFSVLVRTCLQTSERHTSRTTSTLVCRATVLVR